ncbi:MAG: hypothetical protein ACR2MX_09270, partial [Cyclobacteriaceae bacterium]
MKRINQLAIFLLAALLSPWNVQALVKYDEGRRIINGIQLLQDSNDPLAYYYLPQYPRISTKEDGNLDLLCLKFVGKGEQTNGGIFHALIEFSLSPEDLEELKTALNAEVRGAKVVGPVPMMQAFKDGEDGVGSFQVVSSILNDTEGDNAFTQQVIASKHAPLLPNSRTAIAARLNQEGATLLWESLSGPTSDVSVSIKGYYEALVKGYNAIVTADVSTLYEHYSKVINQQEGFNKIQLLKINNELIQSQSLKVEVFDRSEVLRIKAGEMDGILNLVTDKLTELLFDAQTGWAKIPEQEEAIEEGQIKGRQKRGLFRRFFGGAKNQPYISDNQFVLKKREDVRSNTFYLNLSKSTSIKVPIHTSGNLSGVYDSLGVDDRYFRVVNLDDLDFQKREVHFQIDGNYIDSFEDLINFVSINFRKTSADNPDITETLLFNRKDLEEGKDLKTIIYPRLGNEEADWLDYEYQVVWSLIGNNEAINYPTSKSEWASTNTSAISLIPPFKKMILEVDADRALFKEKGAHSVHVKLLTILGGRPMVLRNLLLREDDVENIDKVSLYYDENEPLAYQITWYSTQGKVEKPIEVLSGDYLFLMPPEVEEFA